MKHLILAAAAMLAAATPAAAQNRAFDPREYHGRHVGQPTQILVIGTPHLSGAPDNFDPAVLEPLLARQLGRGQGRQGKNNGNFEKHGSLGQNSIMLRNRVITARTKRALSKTGDVNARQDQECKRRTNCGNSRLERLNAVNRLSLLVNRYS